MQACSSFHVSNMRHLLANTDIPLPFWSQASERCERISPLGVQRFAQSRTRFACDRKVQPYCEILLARRPGEGRIPSCMLASGGSSLCGPQTEFDLGPRNCCIRPRGKVSRLQATAQVVIRYMEEAALG